MKDFLIVAAVLVTWIVLNGWILPWFGIQTCMSGACSRVPSGQATPGATPEEAEPGSRLEDDGTPSPNKSPGMPEG
jgi:hypothetical protein